MRKALSVLVLAVVAIMALPTTSVNALFINVENPLLNSVFDSFSTMRIPNPNKPWDYWWRTLNSAVPAFGRVENQDCAGGVNNDSNCVFAMSQGWNDFVRFSLKPGKPPDGSFYIAQITDVRDSVQGVPLRWEAKPGKPVVLTARIRFSENYNSQGTAGAHGTTGIGFWNNPTETLEEPPYLVVNPIKAVQFTYSEIGNPGGFVGYNAGMTDQSTGNFFPQLRRVDFDMQDWTTQSIVWSIDSNGKDNAKFYIDGHKVAEFTATQPLPAMTFLAWVDCTFIDFAAGGIVCSGPDEEQFMDMDFVSIVQPG